MFRYFVCNYIMCTSEDIELLLNGGYFGRNLGFRTLRMWRKNGTLIFLNFWYLLSKSNEILLLPKNTRNYKWAYTMSADGTILAPHVVFSRPTEGVISFIATCAAVEFSAHRGKSMTAVRHAGTLSRSKTHTQRYTRVDIQRDSQTDRWWQCLALLPARSPVAYTLLT